MKQDMHHLFSIFPHEKTIFKKIKLPFTYVGHPLASNIPINPNIKKAREKLDIRSHQTVLSLLPGSRKGEVKWHLDVLLNAMMQLPEAYDESHHLSLVQLPSYQLHWHSLQFLE